MALCVFPLFQSRTWGWGQGPSPCTQAISFLPVCTQGASSSNHLVSSVTLAFLEVS